MIGKTVDIIISEPLGTFLFNERMLETYIIARDKFLKSDGKMMPTTAHFCIYPFHDDALYQEQMGKVKFWDNKTYHGIDLSCLKKRAIEEKFAQPIVDTYDP